MNQPQTVLVIGGGIAGLGAARELAQQGFKVTLLEASSRLGGRIFTHHPDRESPIELGAEFVHGRSPVLWDLLKSIPLETREVEMNHKILQADGSLEPYPFEEEIEKVTNEIDQKGPDETFTRFLGRKSFPKETRLHALDYVEGFHAAQPDRFSVRALLSSEESSKRIHADHAYRIKHGYDALVECFARELRKAGVQIVLKASVEMIEWLRHSVRVGITGGETFTGQAAIVTVPLAVLKAGTVKFKPSLPEKERAIVALGVGQVTRVVLRFRERFWPEDVGFVHTFDDWIPTWWTSVDRLTLTGWAGGPKGEHAAQADPQTLLVRSADVLARTFGQRSEKIQRSLRELYTHNWSADPCARMAYSFVTAGHEDAPHRLAAPVADTLFFAGEATSLDSQIGTVHGALASGMRAACEFKQSLSSPEPEVAAEPVFQPQ